MAGIRRERILIPLLSGFLVLVAAGGVAAVVPGPVHRAFESMSTTRAANAATTGTENGRQAALPVELSHGEVVIPPLAQPSSAVASSSALSPGAAAIPSAVATTDSPAAAASPVAAAPSPAAVPPSPVASPTLVVASPSASAPAHPVKSAPKTLTYTVKPGDNLYVIAAWFKLHGYQSLYNKNKKTIGSDPALIRPGERFIITGGKMTMVAP